MKEKWQKLPRLDFILIFKTLYVKCETCTPEEFEKNGVYQLSVVYNKKRKFVLDVSGEKNKIFTEARLLAKEWNLKIMDSASVRGKSFWVEPQTV